MKRFGAVLAIGGLACAILLPACSSNHWWGSGGITHCGQPAQYRIRGGFLYKSYEGGIGDCAGLIFDNAPPTNVIVGRTIDVHTFRELWPITDSNPNVLRQMNVDARNYVSTFKVVAAGDATLSVATLCTHETSRGPWKQALNKHCPLLHIRATR